MNVQQYLTRINYHDTIAADNETFVNIHRQHLFTVPFENLDVYLGKRFTLKEEEVYDKVVIRHRGGFCYELNFLLNELLTSLGFKCHMISCRIITEANLPGPEFDHMAVLVTTDRQWIADVGFGDLFITPLEIKEGVQHDGRNDFIVEKEADHFLLSMTNDEGTFQPKYTFNLAPRKIGNFAPHCLDKQVNPGSHFVKNTICTLPTQTGRVTIYNNKFTERKEGERTEQMIETEEQLLILLAERFGVHLK